MKWTEIRLFGIQGHLFLSQVSCLLVASNSFRRCYKGYIYVDKQKKSREKITVPKVNKLSLACILVARGSSSGWAMFTLHWRWFSVFPRHTVALDRNNCIFRVSF